MPPTMPQFPPTPPKVEPETPDIPEVEVDDAPLPPRFQAKPLITVILAAVLCGAGFMLWLSHRRQAGASAPAESTAQASSSDASRAGKDADPGAIATLYELAEPWSSKKFIFVDPTTHASVQAMVIHLPGPPANPSFWAFSLSAPLTRCQLQYLTDLNALAQRYAYSATHPMVIGDCDGTLYDPLQMTTLPDGSWVRGEIVRGGAIRPPVAIQVEVRGRDLFANRIE